MSDAAALALEAMRSRNLMDNGTPPPIPLRPQRPRLDGLTEAPPSEELDVQPRIARHRGTCRICRGRIWEGNDEEQGDEIVPVPGGGWAHYFCANEEAEAA